MQTFYFSIAESKDGDLYVIESRDKKGRFLGVVSEATHEEALSEAKALSLSTLLSFAEDGENPLEALFLRTPKKEHIQLSVQDLFPVFLRAKRCRHGLTQAVVAERLNMRQQVYARLERPGKSNPTLATVDRISSILREDILALA